MKNYRFWGRLLTNPIVQAQAKIVVNLGDLIALCVLLNANDLFNNKA
ncbi:hypothetical protein HD_0359 [[Haemophilus] ducreyi 35000HP]|uniref:Uncharacterized protein n=1 Tax=Haemophilus ducreyi (strain 35000HP / ATCC 700724) TaxID=233412 RepID=Q7VNW7_HAEDU|nr:hypothetical protein [[Haemophilus] ducreyi]AAP95330.1 hypothetical protein HD_0359 [[Haemophilus] ducreyi 35000HP]